jgi:hypothetical protein
MRLFRKSFVLALFLFISQLAIAQISVPLIQGEYYVVELFSGDAYVGVLIDETEKDFGLETTVDGEIRILKLDVDRIARADKSMVDNFGRIRSKNQSPNRTFYMPTAFSMPEGSSSLSINIYGFDYHYSMRKNITFNLSSSFIGAPLTGSIKKTVELSDRFRWSYGGTFGWGSWYEMAGLGAAGFTNFTWGQPNNYFSLGAGLGSIGVLDSSRFNENGAFITMAGLMPMGRKVFLSIEGVYVYTTGNEFSTSPILFITPAIRVNFDNGDAFQFGFSGAVIDGQSIESPIPSLQYIWRIE